MYKVHFPRGTTLSTRLGRGVLQGSPVSLILFLLYLSEPIKFGSFRARFGYADEIRILEIGRTVMKSSTRVQKEIDSLLEWARNNAVSFDFEISEVTQFQGRRRGNPVQIIVNDRNIDPVEKNSLLGIYPDNQLNFKHYVAARHSKALRIAQHASIKLC